MSSEPVTNDKQQKVHKTPAFINTDFLARKNVNIMDIFEPQEGVTLTMKGFGYKSSLKMNNSKNISKRALLAIQNSDKEKSKQLLFDQTQTQFNTVSDDKVIQPKLVNQISILKPNNSMTRKSSLENEKGTSFSKDYKSFLEVANTRNRDSILRAENTKKIINIAIERHMKMGATDNFNRLLIFGGDHVFSEAPSPMSKTVILPKNLNVKSSVRRKEELLMNARLMRRMTEYRV